MFEHYTEKARRVIFFARYEASHFGAQAIDPEHILLGLLREDKEIPRRFFPRPEGAPESIRSEITARVGEGDKVPTSVDLPLSRFGKRVLYYAHEESERLNHQYIGTEHLLLGLLREERSVAFEILSERGMRLEAVRAELERPGEPEPAETRTDVVPETGGESRPTGAVVGLVGDYTEKVARVFPLSRVWAARFASPTVEPEHLLLALIEVDRWLVQYFLSGGTREFAALMTELAAGTTYAVTSAPARPLGATTLRALDHADKEATRSHQEKVDTEHLLLGILDEEESAASRVLRRHGMDPDRIRREAFGDGDDES